LARIEDLANGQDRVDFIAEGRRRSVGTKADGPSLAAGETLPLLTE
jgi:hypothetical protein